MNSAEAAAGGVRAHELRRSGTTGPPPLDDPRSMGRIEIRTEGEDRSDEPRRLRGPAGLDTRQRVGGVGHLCLIRRGCAVTVVFLLDDHESSAAALRTSSGQSDLEVVGEAGTAEEAYGRIRRPPECRILDVNLPDG